MTCIMCGCEIDEMADCCPGCLAGVDDMREAAQITAAEIMRLQLAGDHKQANDWRKHLKASGPL